MADHTLIGVPELAAALGLDQSTVHRRIYEGKLTPFMRVGKNHRAMFRSEDVPALVRGERHLPASAASDSAGAA